MTGETELLAKQQEHEIVEDWIATVWSNWLLLRPQVRQIYLANNFM